MVVGMAIEVPQTEKQREAVARLAAALADAAARASELSKAFNRETESLTIEGYAGEDFLAALALQVSRHGKVDIPDPVTELRKAAEDALEMLRRVQEKEGEGPDAMPWPEIDRLDLALKGMGI